MAEDKLSGKAGLDTTEFKTGIATMNRELRVLESGFKASAASLGDWTKDATGLESRIKSLTSQMEIQQKKVAATREEYERIKKEKGETSRAAQDLEIKLNKETETLGKMESELRETEGSLEEMRSGEEEAGEAAEEMGEQVEESGEKVATFRDVLGGLATMAKAVIATIVAIGAAAVAAVAGIVTLGLNAAETAEQLTDLSNQTGISTTRLQELGFVGEILGTSLDTITGANARLIRSMANAQDQSEDYAKKVADAGKAGKDIEDIKLGDAAQAFQDLGVSVTDANGNLRDNQDVFADLIDALGKVENPAERDALAMSLFGKSAQELNPLIKAGADEMARLSERAHEVGAVMSEEDVAAAAALQDQLDTLKMGFQGIVGKLGAAFGPAFSRIADLLLDKGIPAFEKFINLAADKLIPIIDQVVDAVEQFANGDLAGGLATLFGTENATEILNMINAVKSFIQDTLLPFVTTHAEEIKAALIGIGAAIAAATIIGAIVALVSALNPVTLIIAAIIAAVGLLAAAWTGNWGGIRDTVTQIWEGFLKPMLNQLIGWLTTNIPLALQTLSGIWTGTLLPAIQTVWGFLQENIFPLFAALGELFSAVFNLALTVMAGLWQNVLLPALQTVWGFLQANVFPIFKSIGDYIGSKLQPIFAALATFLGGKMVSAFTGITTAIQKAIDWIKKLAASINNLTLPDWLTPGSPTPWELGLVGINRAMRDLNQQLPILSRGLNLQPSGVAAGGLGTSSVQNSENFAFYAPVVFQGEPSSSGLSQKIKSRRF